MSHEVLDGLHDPRQNGVESLCLHHSRAFDTVDLQLILHKLENFGVTGVAYQLIKSYLNDRQQRLRVTNAKGDRMSSNFSIKWKGVPQGSILGPLLFITYINSPPSNVDIPIILYADDTLAVCVHSDIEKV